VSEKERLTQELERCRELVKVYESIGPNGNFGRVMIEKDIKQGEKALVSGSEPWMKDAADTLAGCE
jgi:hypothetical protein